MCMVCQDHITRTVAQDDRNNGRPFLYCFGCIGELEQASCTQLLRMYSICTMTPRYKQTPEKTTSWEEQYSGRELGCNVAFSAEAAVLQPKNK